MNKYQEYLECVSNTRRLNEQCLDLLHVLLNKQEKYKWHDLRKNPNDLPPINPKNTRENDVYLYVEYGLSEEPKREYFIGHLRNKEPYIIKNEKGDDNFWGLPTYKTNWLIWNLPVFYKSKVIAWKYIEEFEDE